MFTSRSFKKKFGRHSPWAGRGYTPVWPWKACFFALLGLISSALVITAFLLIGNLWKVTEVTVEGTVQYDAADVAMAVGIEAGDGMISFDRGTVRENLRADYPLIRSFSIHRKLNGKVTVKVTEETELYYTCHHSNYYLIAADDMTVLGVTSYGEIYRGYGAVYLGLPEEARVRVGEKITYAYLPYEPVSPPEALATYEIVTGEAEDEYAYVKTFVDTVMNHGSMQGRITGMELGDRYDLYLIFDGHVKIRFGSIKELSRKLEVAVEILAKELDGSGTLAVLDVSDPTKSTYREDSELILPDWAAS